MLFYIMVPYVHRLTMHRIITNKWCSVTTGPTSFRQDSVQTELFSNIAAISWDNDVLNSPRSEC